MTRNDVVMELPPGPGPGQPPQPAVTAAPMVYVHERTEWEYRIVVRGADEPLREEELNALGKDGWELAGLTPVERSVHFYFKRTR